MTPQELIDMPGYGKAEKHLRKVGKWKLSPIEVIENSLGSLEVSLDMANSAMYEIEDVWRLIK